MSEAAKAIRCAIYTRKSSEEGLEQSFNSLDAQREASEAFIASQKHQGWRIIPTHYDDGGYSGGTMERPGLQQLLQDVAGNKIDCVVVYKVDRLTRSLADFAKIVEAWDVKGVSFVSVTQQFNTTSSMGRLTLNILLSFAQFEREVTGERIRDKIAASKKKGMWMGGPVPLGYEVKDRKLMVNPREAKLVRELFEQYLELGCVRKLKDHVDAKGIKSKIRKRANGQKLGGTLYSRGALYKILNNPICIGQIRHKGQCHPGQHPAILPNELWNKVQTKLRSDNQGRREGIRAIAPSLLVGLLYNEHGIPFSPSYTSKNGRRYRYYILRPREGEGEPETVDTSQLVRLPAGEIESAVLGAIESFLRLEHRVMDEFGWPKDRAEHTQKLLSSASRNALLLGQKDPATVSHVVKKTIDRVCVYPGKVEIAIRRNDMRSVLVPRSPSFCDAARNNSSLDGLVRIEFPARLKRSGREVRLILAPSEQKKDTRPSGALLKAVARAHDWRQQITNGDVSSLAAIAKKNGLHERYVHHIFRFAFLAPDIVEEILDGRQPQDLTIKKLKQPIPINWREQRLALVDPS